MAENEDLKARIRELEKKLAEAQERYNRFEELAKLKPKDLLTRLTNQEKTIGVQMKQLHASVVYDAEGKLVSEDCNICGKPCYIEAKDWEMIEGPMCKRVHKKCLKDQQKLWSKKR